MKANFGASLHQSTREFTDREEPRKAFWEQYEALSSETEKEVQYKNKLKNLKRLKKSNAVQF